MGSNAVDLRVSRDYGAFSSDTSWTAVQLEADSYVGLGASASWWSRSTSGPASHRVGISGTTVRSSTDHRRYPARRSAVCGASQVPRAALQRSRSNLLRCGAQAVSEVESVQRLGSLAARRRHRMDTSRAVRRSRSGGAIVGPIESALEHEMGRRHWSARVGEGRSGSRRRRRFRRKRRRTDDGQPAISVLKRRRIRPGTAAWRMRRSVLSQPLQRISTLRFAMSS